MLTASCFHCREFSHWKVNSLATEKRDFLKAPLPLAPEFVRNLRLLGRRPTLQQINENLIKKYGTHFLVSATLGGKARSAGDMLVLGLVECRGAPEIEELLIRALRGIAGKTNAAASEPHPPPCASGGFVLVLFKLPREKNTWNLDPAGLSPGASPAEQPRAQQEVDYIDLFLHQPCSFVFPFK